MKLNHDLVRLVMLEIEDKATHTNSLDINDLKFPEHTNGEISYVIEKLDEAGLINVNITRFLGGEFIFDITSLTWSGHQFLDNIRDDSVWKQTKGILSKLSSASLSVVSDVASKVITNMINQQLGL